MRLATPIIALSLAFVATSDASRSIFSRQSEPIPSTHYNGPGLIAGSPQAFRENDALYIHGGETQSTGGEVHKKEDLFYKLDLSVAWNTSDPAWTRLYTSKSLDHIALSKDGLTLFAGIGEFIVPYQTQRNKWWKMISRWKDKSTMKVDWFQLGDVTDPDSGIIYGMMRAKSGEVWATMFDPFNGKMSYKNVIHNGEAAYAESDHGVFVPSRKSIFYLQSTPRFVDTLNPERMFQEYRIADNRIDELTTTGDVPSIRVDPCVVPAYAGTKLIVLGGANVTVDSSSPLKNRALNGVYMLDVATLAWTRLTDAPSPYYKPICAVSGNYLVAYGGYSAYGGPNSTIVMNGGDPSILDLKENVWVTAYKPSLSTARGSRAIGAISLLSSAVLIASVIMSVGL